MTRELSAREISQAWFDGDVHTLRVEIERLQSEVKALHETIGEIDRQHAAEIERLKIESNDRVAVLLAQIVALRIVIERLRAYRTAADAYLMGLNDHLHGNLRPDLTVLRANWDAARAALERKTPEEIISP